MKKLIALIVLCFCVVGSAQENNTLLSINNNSNNNSINLFQLGHSNDIKVDLYRNVNNHNVLMGVDDHLENSY